MKGKWIGFVVCAVLAAWAASVEADPPPLTLWASQIGTSGYDYGMGIAVDASGNSYIAGYTSGDLAGPNQGSADAFVAKYDSGGTMQWTRQIGTSHDDVACSIAVDGSGNSYITGYTTGDLGGPMHSAVDAFIVAYDSGGTVRWSRQIGTSMLDMAWGIAVDGSGNSYITGHTYGNLGGPNQGGRDAFIVACDSAGTEQWTRQIGSSGDDNARRIAVDGSGNSYVTGYTDGDLGGPNQGYTDAFIVKYDSGGTEQWRRQIGTGGPDAAWDVALDSSGNSYIAGSTFGDLGGPNQGSEDAFIVKYDSGGVVQWMSQVGTTGQDFARGIAVDASGNRYVTGISSGDLGGPNHGISDAFIVKYDTVGPVQWIRQIGTLWQEQTLDIGVDGSGNSYITGYTYGNLGGPYQGNGDAFIVAIGSTPAGAGDSNVDGCTDGLDYVIWANHYDPLTGGKAWGHGDSNEDGIVDGLDYILWSNNYLAGCPAAVPEPGALALLALGALALLRRRRHKA